MFIRIAMGTALLLALSSCGMQRAAAPAEAASKSVAPEATAVAANAAQSVDAALVLPGPFAEATTRADFEKLFGPSNARVTEERDAEGNVQRGLVLFPDDPARRAYARFYDEEMTHLAAIEVNDAGSLWRGKRGVHVGMSLAELRRANGKPFYFYGFDSEHRAWARDQWSPALDDAEPALGALDVGENDHLYFGVDLGLRGGGKDIPAAAYPQEDSISSDDPRYPRLGEIVEVTAITAYSSLDDEWQ